MSIDSFNKCVCSDNFLKCFLFIKLKYFKINNMAGTKENKSGSYNNKKVIRGIDKNIHKRPLEANYLYKQIAHVHNSFFFRSRQINILMIHTWGSYRIKYFASMRMLNTLLIGNSILNIIF